MSSTTMQDSLLKSCATGGQMTGKRDLQLLLVSGDDTGTREQMILAVTPVPDAVSPVLDGVTLGPEATRVTTCIFHFQFAVKIDLVAAD